MSESTLPGSLLIEDTPTAELAFIRLSVPKIAGWWSFLRPLVAKAIVRTDEATMMNIYDNLIDEVLDCWIAVTKEKRPSIVGVIIGGITVDLLVGYRNYLIYGILSLRSFSDSEWLSFTDSLSKWAVGNKCNRIVAFTDNDRAIEVAKLIGARADLVMIEKEL